MGQQDCALQEAACRLSAQVTEAGIAKLSLGRFEVWTDQALNGATGFGIFPLRVEMTMRPSLTSGAPSADHPIPDELKSTCAQLVLTS